MSFGLEAGERLPNVQTGAKERGGESGFPAGAPLSPSEHRNCRRPGLPADGMYSDDRGDQAGPHEDFTCTICGQRWVRSGPGWGEGVERFDPVFAHNCQEPRWRGRRRPWTCPICGRNWEPMGKGSWRYDTVQQNVIESVTMREPDGTKRIWNASGVQIGTVYPTKDLRIRLLQEELRQCDECGGHIDVLGDCACPESEAHQ